MLSKSVILLGILSIVSNAVADDWWKNIQLYQIYPRSYKDSDGDGIGDIKGITENLEHLKDIGVEATWLSPIFTSPMNDFGYDIANFYEIAEEYGTLEDFKALVEKAKSLGLRVLLDFVPNHSSHECQWFQKSVRNESGYENFYVWHDGRVNPEGGRNLPPSNWISVFRGSAWTWNEERKQYYLHQFLKEQPDFNFRDPAVIEEFKSILRYWLDQGVDGFRVDAIPHLVEIDVDEDGNYPDEPLSGHTDDPEDYNYLEHIYTREREETFSQVFIWRKVLDDYAAEHGTEEKILLMEAMSDTKIVMEYYGNATHEGAHMPFNFQLVFLPWEAKAQDIKNSVDYWYSQMPTGRTTNWVIGNHDQRRLASRFGPSRSDGFVMLGMVLPGVSVTYQGEEIAMEDQFLTWEDTMDPQACNSGQDLYNITSRDPARTPFQWDRTKNAGFSTGDKTWLPVADNYLTLNLELQKSAATSAYKVYKDMAEIRRTHPIHHGDFKIETIGEVLLVKRALEVEAKLFLFNTGDDTFEGTVLDVFPELRSEASVDTLSRTSDKSKGDILDLSNVKLIKHEALVLSANGAGSLALSINVLALVMFHLRQYINV